MQKEYLFQSTFLARHRELLGGFTYPVFMAGFTWLYFWGLAAGVAVETWVVAVTVINSATKPLPLILLGAPTEIIVFLGMWTVFDGNMVHANIHQRCPGWFHYVMGTVHLHNLHHAQDRKYQDSN